VRQAEELCSCAGCRATLGSLRESLAGLPPGLPGSWVRRPGVPWSDRTHETRLSRACLGQPWPPDQGARRAQGREGCPGRPRPAIGQPGPRESAFGNPARGLAPVGSGSFDLGDLDQGELPGQTDGLPLGKLGSRETTTIDPLHSRRPH
jgi:hypothetical protein